jgi:DNA invertase Pin-like site-specific DNA recombinase
MAVERTVAYFRMSEDKQETSIPQQKAWAERAAVQHHLEIVRAFQDEGIAGDEIGRRTGLQGLIDFCEREARAKRPISAVLVWDQDRFSRADSFATAAILGRLMSCGVTRMITNAQAFDFTDDRQRVFYNLSQDLGKRAYSKAISATVSRTRAEKAALGVWTGSVTPFGYVVGPDGHLALGPAEEVATVAWIYRRYLEGVGLKKIAGELAASGRVPRSRKNRTGWTDDLVHRIVSNPAYKGTLCYNVTTAGKYHRLAGGRVVEYHAPRHASDRVKVVKSDPADVISCDNAHPAIVEPEVWEAAQRQLVAKRTRPGGSRKTEIYPLSGLLYCSECGAVMHGITVVRKRPSGRATWKKYMCSRYLHGGKAKCKHNAVLEADVVESMALVLADHFSDDSAVDDVRRQLQARRHARSKESDTGLKRLRKRVEALGESISRASRNLALAHSEADFRRVSTAIDAWEKEREEVSAQMEELQRQADLDEQQTDQVEEALKQLSELSAVLMSAPPEKVAKVARAMIERVELSFEHGSRPSGRITSICTGGVIHLKDNLGVPTAAEFWLRNSASTSRQRRVSRKRRSIGW